MSEPTEIGKWRN